MSVISGDAVAPPGSTGSSDTREPAYSSVTPQLAVNPPRALRSVFSLDDLPARARKRLPVRI